MRRWRIVELDDETRLTTSRLRLDERILHFLVGSPYLDARLHGLLRRATVPDALPASYDQTAGRVAAGWSGRARAPLRVELVGGDLRTRADIAAVAARRLGLGLYEMSAADLPTDPAQRDLLARLWQREAILLPAALLVEVGEMDREQAAATDAFIESAAVPLVVSSPDPRQTARPAVSASPFRRWTRTSSSECGPMPSPTSPMCRRSICVTSWPSSRCRRIWSARPAQPWPGPARRGRAGRDRPGLAGGAHRGPDGHGRDGPPHRTAGGLG
ncbi:hypothetical protein NKH18_40805 [Streptomyces sp. M10(2022)]